MSVSVTYVHDDHEEILEEQQVPGLLFADTRKQKVWEPRNLYHLEMVHSHHVERMHSEKKRGERFFSSSPSAVVFTGASSCQLSVPQPMLPVAQT